MPENKGMKVIKFGRGFEYLKAFRGAREELSSIQVDLKMYCTKCGKEMEYVAEEGKNPVGTVCYECKKLISFFKKVPKLRTEPEEISCHFGEVVKGKTIKTKLIVYNEGGGKLLWEVWVMGKGYTVITDVDKGEFEISFNSKGLVVAEYLGKVIIESNGGIKVGNLSATII